MEADTNQVDAERIPHEAGGTGRATGPAPSTPLVPADPAAPSEAAPALMPRGLASLEFIGPWVARDVAIALRCDGEAGAPARYVSAWTHSEFVTTPLRRLALTFATPNEMGMWVGQQSPSIRFQLERFRAVPVAILEGEFGEGAKAEVDAAIAKARALGEQERVKDEKATKAAPKAKSGVAGA